MAHSAVKLMPYDLKSSTEILEGGGGVGGGGGGGGGGEGLQERRHGSELMSRAVASRCC